MGFNLQNEMLPFVTSRLKSVSLGRIKHEYLQTDNVKLNCNLKKETSIQGRIVLDILQLILMDHKVTSQTLESMAFHFLKAHVLQLTQDQVTSFDSKGPASRT